MGWSGYDFQVKFLCCGLIRACSERVQITLLISFVGVCLFFFISFFILVVVELDLRFLLCWMDAFNVSILLLFVF